MVFSDFDVGDKESLDEGVRVDVVFLDFKKAFDKVSHYVLLKKLGTSLLHPRYPAVHRGALTPCSPLLPVFSEALGCKEMEVAVVTKENVWLVPENQSLVWEEITWSMRPSSGVQYRIVTLAKRDGHVELNTDSPLGRRVTFHPGNLSLQIELVNKSDSGVYSIHVTSPSGITDNTCFRVSVFDRVQQPNLTVLSAHAELRQCNVTLSCQVQDADTVAYSWSRGASWSPATGDQQLPGNQSQLQLKITEGSSDTFYHCNASNAASWGTATIDVKRACHFPATDIFQSLFYWIIGAIACGLVFLAIGVIILCRCCKKQASSRPGERPITIYDEVDETCFCRNLDGNAQGSMIGNTIYSEVLAKGQKPNTRAPREIGCTLYSTIQPHAQPDSVKKRKLNPALTSTIYMEVNEPFGRPLHTPSSALLPPKRCLPIPSAGGLRAPQHYNL
ncbi:natural killer cell receptor 2B4-like [Alligator sinensis]|uniref:Natural killer cell receptor 2B4-like n=1 Tax=Alligator sinensis TaxID=38654 RepID=A0A3Q0FL94_ALLSI|nr:natural killer cell receptor 2B4-like [Alligator sinensis]